MHPGGGHTTRPQGWARNRSPALLYHQMSHAACTVPRWQKTPHGKWGVSWSTLLSQWVNFAGWLSCLQPLPIRSEFILVQFRPGFDKSVLTSWEGTTDQLNSVNAINTHSLLVVGVKMRPVMWCTGFSIHTNN